MNSADKCRPAISRRQLLVGAGGMGLLAMGCSSSSPAGPAKVTWPDGRLGPTAAQTVDPAQFMPVTQLRQWSEELDAMGMRATGNPVHEHFIDILVGRLEQAGAEHVHTEPVPFKKWTVGRWSLQSATPEASDVPTASYIPYSGHTPPDGVTGALVAVEPGSTPPPGSLTGKIAVVDVPSSPVTYSTMEEISYGRYDPQGLIDPTAEYSRPWGGVVELISLLDALVIAGASGCVAIIDLPAAGAHGSYYPYDGIIRTVPGVFVDAATGVQLKAQAATGAKVRLTLTGTTEPFVSRNVVGLVPGRTDELVILNSHTDGPNAVEDNGPNTIIAMVQYLRRLPKDALPRSVLVSFTTGHFHNGIGQVTFARDHRDTTLRNTACALTLEHLGALEWEEDAEGSMALTGRPELGVVFVPENKAMAAASLAALRRAGAGPALALKPYVSAPGSPNGYGWPGEGTQLWSDGHVMTMNYITGPTYLLNWGVPTIKKTDFNRLRREAISFTQMALDLSRVPRSSLSDLDLPPL